MYTKYPILMLPSNSMQMTLPDFGAEDLAIEPLARSETIPSSWYTDARFHDLDRRAVFGRTWQYVGAVSDLESSPQQGGDGLQNPPAKLATTGGGTYLTETVAGNPVIVVRDTDGQLRAFYNVCRHRGGPLAMDRCGAARMLQCKYHGWTYKLDGTLRGVPRFDRTELFDKRDFGLKPVALRQWEGMLFACLDPESAPPFEEVVAGIQGRIAPIAPGTYQFHRRDLYDVSCNWKVYVDNYLEGYHIPLVHPELCDLLDFRDYQTEIFEHYSLQSSPFRPGDNIYGNGEGTAFYYFVYPNIMLNILPGRMQVNRVDALTPDTCRVVFDYYYENPDADQVHGRIAQDLEFSDKVQAEDAEICEHVQRGLSSNGYDRGRFSVEMEAGVHHFQSQLKRSYTGAATVANNAT